MANSFPLVRVWGAAGKRQVIGDVVKAAEVLLVHWPEEFAHTPAHRAARMACLNALEGEGDSLDARAAFVLAAEEAGILSEG